MKLKFGMVGGAGGGISPMHMRGATIDFMAELTAGCFSRNAERDADRRKLGEYPTSAVFIRTIR